MGYVTTSDGVDIFYKDWGPKEGKVIFFHHGWPLSSDDWDAQMLFFVDKGFRVVAHDRRGHGRSSQVWDGHDMDHYADDVAAVVKHLGVQGAMHVGHSTGGGEVVRYIVRHGEDNVSRAVLISAVPPLMVKTDSNPQGTPRSVFDDFQAQLAASRAQFYYDIPAGPFYGYNRPGSSPSEAVIWNWWRQGMMGEPKRTTTVSSRSRRRISRKISSASRSRFWLSTAMTIRSFPTMIPAYFQPGCSKTVR